MTLFNRLKEHYEEALEHFDKDHIVGLFLQGSQNYGLDTPDSDVDTKLIVVPSFKDIAMNKKPVSTTHVRANEEHIDWKDIRLYMQTFRKQNLNFLEILFTGYSFTNSLYVNEWTRLVDAREAIARMNPVRAVKSMKGIALEKFHAMEHHYPSKMELIHKYGYDPKQTSHLVRVRDYLERYTQGETYEACLKPSEKYFDLIMDLKLKKYSLEEARKIALDNLNAVEKISNDFCSKNKEEENQEIAQLLEDVSYQIMKISVTKELGKTESSSHNDFLL